MKHKHITKKTKLLAIFAAIVAIPIIGTVVAYAYGYSGGGGLPSGCSTPSACPYYTRYGHGWYLYDVNGNGPKGGIEHPSKKNTNAVAPDDWATAKSRCKAKGISKVAVYVVLRWDNTSGDPVNGYARGYAYSGFNTGIHPAGNGWISPSTARSEFLKTGDTTHTFGVNLVWFCYGQDTSWKLTGYAQISTDGGKTWSDGSNGRAYVNIGDTVKWRFRMYNDGVKTSNISAYAAYYNEKVGTDSIPIAKTKFSDVKDVRPNKNPVNAKSYTDYVTVSYTIPESNENNLICYLLRFTPSSKSGGTVNNSSGYSNAPCVQVNIPPAWSTHADTSIKKNSGSYTVAYEVGSGTKEITAYPGDVVKWRFRVHNDSYYSTATGLTIRSKSYQKPNGGLSTGEVLQDPFTTNHSQAKRSNTGEKFTTTWNITDSHVGKTYCKRTQWKPVKKGTTTESYTAWACVKVLANTVAPSNDAKVQVWGNDLRVGSGFKGESPNNDANVEGNKILKW